MMVYGSDLVQSVVGSFSITMTRSMSNEIILSSIAIEVVDKGSVLRATYQPSQSACHSGVTLARRTANVEISHLRRRAFLLHQLTFNRVSCASLRSIIAITTIMASSEEAPGPIAPEAKSVLYCPHCTFPPEYCTFSSSASKCKAWLIESHPDLAEKIYGSSSSAPANSEDTGEKSSKKAAKASAADGGAASDATGLETKLEEGLTLKQKEDEDREREKKERREEKKKEKEDKERKVSRSHTRIHKNARHYSIGCETWLSHTHTLLFPNHSSYRLPALSSQNMPAQRKRQPRPSPASISFPRPCLSSKSSPKVSLPDLPRDAQSPNLPVIPT